MISHVCKQLVIILTLVIHSLMQQICIACYPAFAYAEPPSSWPLSRVECLPGSRHRISACSVRISVPAQPRDHCMRGQVFSSCQRSDEMWCHGGYLREEPSSKKDFQTAWSSVCLTWSRRTASVHRVGLWEREKRRAGDRSVGPWIPQLTLWVK